MAGWVVKSVITCSCYQNCLLRKDERKTLSTSFGGADEMTADGITDNTDPSLGYYPSPGWEWQKPAPKASLVASKLDRFAQGWILNLVELVHWLPFIPTFILAYLIFHHSGDLKPLLGDSDLRVFLLLLSPLIQTFGGLMGITMHEYEGWQVAFFKNPLDCDFAVDHYNNEWLREVAYKLLFLLQGVGLLAFSLAVFGFSIITIPFAVLSGLIAFIGPQNPKATFLFNGQPVFPLAVSILAVFIVNAIVNFVAYFSLLGDPLVLAGLPRALAALAPLLLMLGGMIEGIVAESSFNQWWHFIAVVFLNLGMVAQILLFPLLW